MTTAVLKRGDRVSWHSQGQVIEGVVVKKITGSAEIKHHHVNASPAHPEYLVKSDKTGAEAAHYAHALTKI